MIESARPVRRKLIGLLLVFLAVRVVTPAGYMPAPIGEGLPFVLCPGGLSGASLILAANAKSGGDHRHAAHHGHDTGAGAHFEFCPYGTVLGAAAIGNDPEPVLRAFRHILVSSGPRLEIRRQAAHSFHARAPPSLTSRLI